MQPVDALYECVGQNHAGADQGRFILTRRWAKSQRLIEPQLATPRRPLVVELPAAKRLLGGTCGGTFVNGSKEFVSKICRKLRRSNRSSADPQGPLRFLSQTSPNCDPSGPPVLMVRLPLFSCASICAMPPLVQPRFWHSADKHRNQRSALSLGTSHWIGQSSFGSKRLSRTSSKLPVPSGNEIIAFDFAFVIVGTNLYASRFSASISLSNAGLCGTSVRLKCRSNALRGVGSSKH
jgi:hypothetical protein